MDLGEGDLFPQLVGVQPPSESNISDVLQAIEAVDRVEAVDPAAAVTVPSPEATPVAAAGAMYSGGGMVHATGGHHSSHHRDRPHTVITEQPASKALRFRYECEGRSAGSIPGVRSTSENKTFPTIQVMNYVGRAVVVVSCVTADRPHKPHPHNLVGKEMCKDGVCTSQINPETMQATFNNLGIQCVKKKDIEEALRTREAIRVDPFKTGFSHRSQPQSIDLNALRLCFQVFLEQDGKFKIPLAPVVSDIIYDKKAMSDLLITRLSHCSASVAGGQEVVLLCEKVAKDDISVWMVELKDDGETVVWESRAEINLVHKQVAIGFRTPAYKDLQVQRSIKAHVQLVRPSDNAKSAPRPFELRPISENIRKRPRYSPVEYSMMDVATSRDLPIKAEPKDTMPMPFDHATQAQVAASLQTYRAVHQTLSPSPQYNVPSPQYNVPSPSTQYHVATPSPQYNIPPSPEQPHYHQYPPGYSPEHWPYEQQQMGAAAQQMAAPTHMQLGDSSMWAAGMSNVGITGASIPGTDSDFPSINTILQEAGASLQNLEQLNISASDLEPPQPDHTGQYHRNNL